MTAEGKVTGLFPGGETGWGSALGGGVPTQRKETRGATPEQAPPLSGSLLLQRQGEGPRWLGFPSGFGWAPGKALVSSQGYLPRGGCFGEPGGERGALPMAS